MMGRNDEGWSLGREADEEEPEHWRFWRRRRIQCHLISVLWLMGLGEARVVVRSYANEQGCVSIGALTPGLFSRSCRYWSYCIIWVLCLPSPLLSMTVEDVAYFSLSPSCLLVVSIEWRIPLLVSLSTSSPSSIQAIVSIRSFRDQSCARARAGIWALLF